MNFFKKLFPNASYRRYKKMCKKHKRNLRKLFKDISPFDYDNLHDIVKEYIKFMYHYYCAGDNVWQAEEERQRVISSLKEVVSLIEEQEHLWDNTGTESIKSELLPDGSWHCDMTEEQSKRFEKLMIREDELYGLIYSKIGEYITSWWD